MAVIPFRWLRETESSEKNTTFPLTSLQREVNRLMDSFFNDSTWVPTSTWSGAFVPSLDVSETEKAFHVDVDLPGMDEKDVELTLNQNVLTIKGEKKVERQEQEKNFARMERTQGSFLRSIPFDVDLDENKVEAHYKNGVLSITLPKAPSAIKEAKKITIKS